MSLCDKCRNTLRNENARLEREHQFWQREIVVKIEYKFCPNLTIIDTPGAIRVMLTLVLVSLGCTTQEMHFCYTEVCFQIPSVEAN